MPRPRTATPHPNLLRRLFDHAFGLPAAERAAWLARECGPDIDLQQRVLAMLAAAANDHFLSELTGLQPATATSRTCSVQPRRPRAASSKASGVFVGSPRS